MKGLREHLSQVSRTAVFFACVIVFFASNTGIAYAGFGITPPYVHSERLTRGTVYKQVINLVRSDPNQDLQTEITTNIPGADSWFSVDVGKSFILPKGQQQMPITIIVNVPKDAPYQEFKGSIRIRTAPVAGAVSGSGVSIALGAQVDVDVKVVDKIFDFEVRRVSVQDLEEGRMIWGLFFPGKIRFLMTIENTGNTEFGPTRVHLDIYDSEMETLLESTDNTNGIKKLAAFSTQDVVAELPTRLPAGRYIAKYTIYKNADIAQQNTLNLSVSTVGTVIGYEGYGFDGLSLTDKLKAIAAIGVPVLLFLVLIVIVIRKRRPRRRTQTTLR